MSILHAIGIFVSSNIDNLLVLMVLFCLPQLSAKSIVISQFLSQTILMASSMVIAALAFQTVAHYVGLIGILPLGIGIERLVERYRGRHSGNAGSCVNISAIPSSVGAITLLMLSTGGDNLSVYVPVFALNTTATVAYFCSIFFLMAAVWCIFAYCFARHPVVGAVVRRYSERFLPWNMIGLGVYVLSSPVRFLLR